MSKTTVSLQRGEDYYLEAIIASGADHSSVIPISPYSYGGFILPAEVDAHVITFRPQEFKMDAEAEGDLLRLDGTEYECTPVANGAYALPGALMGHMWFRFHLASTAEAERVIKVHLSN